MILLGPGLAAFWRCSKSATSPAFSPIVTARVQMVVQAFSPHASRAGLRIAWRAAKRHLTHEDITA
jgi:hypothetical protein